MSSFSSSSASNHLWLSNLLYLHSTNQPSLLGSYTPHTTANQHILTPTITELLTVPLSNSPLHNTSTPIAVNFVVTNSIVPNSAVFVSTIPNSTVPASTSITNLIPISSSTTTVHNQHPMQTRSKSGITKQKLCYKIVIDYSYTKLPTYKIASQYPKWCETMDTEF